MKATIAFHEPVRSTIFSQTATGHAIVVDLPAKIGGSVVILVDDPDHEAINRLLTGSSKLVQVTDLLTNQERTLKSAPCGAHCRCAVAFA